MAANHSQPLYLAPVALAVLDACRGLTIPRPRLPLNIYVRAGGPFRSLPPRAFRG